MNPEIPSFSRREALNRAGFGIGSLALAGLLNDMGLTQAHAANLSPLAVRQPQFPSKAKRVIHLFMNGGPSQMDTFDPKPKLNELHGKSLPIIKNLTKDKRLSGAASDRSSSLANTDKAASRSASSFPMWPNMPTISAWCVPCSATCPITSPR